MAPTDEVTAKVVASRVERKRVERIDRILRVAAQVLTERGYHNTSLEMVAERMDLTKASLYHYFDSKDALFSACLERVARQSIEEMSRIVETEGPAAERLRTLVLKHITILTRVEPEMSRLFLQPFDWPESMSAEVRRWRSLHSKPFHEIIDSGIESGEFKPRNDQVARHCMFGAINYVPVWFRAGTKAHDDEILGAVADEVVSLFSPSA